MKFSNSMNRLMILATAMALLIGGSILGQKRDDTFIQLEYFHQPSAVNHSFVAFGVVKFFPLFNRVTADYHYSIGADVKNGGIYMHVPASAVLGYIVTSKTPNVDWNTLAILFTLIPEGIGMWLGDYEKGAHLSLNISGMDFYTGYHNIPKHLDYIPNISFQQVIFDDTRWGSLVGTTSLGYEYQKKWSPQNACIRLGIAICPNH